ncbi:hypothetical protein D9619_004946 [Psilocybe cf. subviscida]|uniref:Cytochrome P450 n=1 Tax=Psilocybe cf. subviscida TaxID=2480587 RepID=A0A8H5F8L5_9AGAR|nr:hypothetical protein D9619_004946 [Psilocybe cf. subviscida]
MLAIFVGISVLWLLQRGIRALLHKSTLKNIPGPPASSWLTGSFHQLAAHNGWDFHRNISETYGGVARIKGLLGADMLYVHDPKLLHHILVKELDIFEEQDLFIEANRLFFGEGVLASLGDRHRMHRKMLSPMFAPQHLRELTPIFYTVARKVQKAYCSVVANGPQEVDVVSWNTRVALELIAQAGLDYTFDTLEVDSKPHPYAIAAKELAPAATDSWIQLVQKIALPIIPRLGPPKFRRWLLDVLPLAPLHKVRDIVDTLHNTSVEIYESKKRAFESGKASSLTKDIISMILQENAETPMEERLSEKEILGQITAVTFAATDTTSNTISRILCLLADHKDIQLRLRTEIREARRANHDHDLEYEELLALPLLDAVVKETLRVFPPVTNLSRIAREDSVLPLWQPIKGLDGTQITEIPVEKGTEIHFSILASNRDPQTWGPDSYEWKPDRWLQPLPEALLDAKIPGVFSHLMTFIGGGRSCLGFKFSELEMKVVLTLLLDKLEFTPTGKKIVWVMSNISTPNVEGSPDPVPKIPIIISRAD